MTDERLAKHVFEVFSYGLSLKERLDRGDRPHYETEVDKLKGMLWGDSELGRSAVYAGAVAASNQKESLMVSRRLGPNSTEFMGARYALCCWLDEIFILDSPWAQRWTENTMETALYAGTQERAWRFWLQAEQAEKRPESDAVEVYLWCVMLGFRGSPSIDPVTWTERVRKRVLGPLEKEYPAPADRAFPADGYPRKGLSSFKGMVRLGGVVAACGVFAAGYAIAKLLNK